MESLKDKALLKNSGDTSYVLKDTDIVMGMVGDTIGVIFNGDERVEKSQKEFYCIIDSADRSLEETLKSNREKIMSLAKGSVLPRVFLKDLGNLEIF